MIDCYLCNSNNTELVTDTLRYPSSGKVYKCLNCNLNFLYPRMSPEEERAFYEKEYGEIYSNEKGTTPDDLFNARQSDAKLYSKWAEKYLNNNIDCLEIGCASGYFLYEIKDKVKSVSGIETHYLLRQYCEEMGINTYNNLDNCPDENFDLVFLFFVLEHIGEPFDFFYKLRRVLKKDGKIFIVVPNADDALLSLYDIPGFRNYYFTPAHQFYYTKDTLAKLLKKVGFHKYDIQIKQRYDLSNHMYWMMYGKPGGMGRYNNIFSPELNDKYKEDLINAGKGDTLIAIVEKEESEFYGKKQN